jgi:Interferon-induced transmembrane protein
MSYHGSGYYGGVRDSADYTPPPNNHLVWAILSTAFCCLIPGIVSIVYAAQVNGKHAMGDYHGALDAANSAKNWAWASFFLALVSVLPAVILLVISGSINSSAGG